MKLEHELSELGESAGPTAQPAASDGVARSHSSMKGARDHGLLFFASSLGTSLVGQQLQNAFPTPASWTDVGLFAAWLVAYFFVFLSAGFLLEHLLQRLLRFSVTPWIASLLLTLAIHIILWPSRMGSMARAAALVSVATGSLLFSTQLYARIKCSRWFSVGLRLVPWMLPLGLLLTFVLNRVEWRVLDQASINISQLQISPRLARVVLLGIDGLDPTLLEQLVEQGALPNFQSAMERGAFGPLTTVSPHSPVVWTSIATGQPVNRHGVNRYTARYLKGTSIILPEHHSDFLGQFLYRHIPFSVEAAVSSNQRQVKAMWEIFSDFGRRSCVANWWATWPAEPISGLMISNLALPWTGFSELEISQTRSLPATVYPPERQGEIGERVARQLESDEAKALKRDAFSEAGSSFFLPCATPLFLT